LAAKAKRWNQNLSSLNLTLKVSYFYKNISLFGMIAGIMEKASAFISDIFCISRVAWENFTPTPHRIVRSQSAKELEVG
jgi:hypothetical protein